MPSLREIVMFWLTVPMFPAAARLGARLPLAAKLSHRNDKVSLDPNSSTLQSVLT
jgi:hypothetical protein